MHELKRNFRIVLTIGAAMALAAACRQENPAPNFTATAEIILPRAEAEARGSTPPLELTLRVFRTRIRAGKGLLWYRIVLRNSGPEDVIISDAAFRTPVPVEIHGSRGLSLEVIGPDGKRVKEKWRPPHHSTLAPDSPDWPIQPGDTRSEAAKKKIMDEFWAGRDRLRRRGGLEHELRFGGASAAEIDRRLKDFDARNPEPQIPDSIRPARLIVLKPGQSVVNIPWTERKTSDPERLDAFSEFTGYQYDKPGRYRITAAFDNRASNVVGAYDKKHGIPLRPGSVLVKTIPIEFEVQP